MRSLRVRKDNVATDGESDLVGVVDDQTGEIVAWFESEQDAEEFEDLYYG